MKIRGKLLRKQLAIRLILIFLVFLLILIIVGLVREIINRHRVSDNISELERQIGQAQSENLEINTLISSWENGSRLEKEARSKLGLKKDGERVVLITKSSTSDSVTPDQALINSDILGPQSNSDEALASNFSKWWQYFFK